MKIIEWPFHPFLFAVYPILFLIAHNDLPFWRYAPLPMLVLLMATGIFFVGLRYCSKSLLKAAMTTSGIVIVFFSVGPTYDALAQVLPYLGKDAIWLVMIFDIVLVVLVLRLVGKALRETTLIANMTAILLVVFGLTGIVFNFLERQIGGGMPLATEATVATEQKSRPDVYMIVLDSYAGQECLEEVYHFDNNDFYDALRKRGFTVVENSRSNYLRTQYSIPSILNMQYIDDMFDKKALDTWSVNRLKRLMFTRLLNNDVATFFRAKGYRYIHILNGWQDTGLRKVHSDDVIIRSKNDGEFLSLLTDMSLFRFLKYDPYNEGQRKETLWTLDLLRQLPKQYTDKPKMVCVHVFTPQEPYCFGADGSRTDHYHRKQIDNETHVRYYLNQIRYINNQMQELVDSIVRDSSQPPIIIIMSDHSSRLPLSEKEHLIQYPNLIAVSLPKGLDTELPRGLSNVNLFRYILNLEFGENYPYLPTKYFVYPLVPIDQEYLQKLDGKLNVLRQDHPSGLFP